MPPNFRVATPVRGVRQIWSASATPDPATSRLTGAYQRFGSWPVVMADDDKLGELIGVPHAIGVLGHAVACPALASGALPVIVGEGRRVVRCADVARLSAAARRRARGDALPSAATVAQRP